jgi:xanthine dehydrogenase YagR molybdenum-binding subunit
MRMDRRRGRLGSSVGAPLDRVDGRLKVTGAATYTADRPVAGLAHAALVQSTIARGRLSRLDTSAADAAPGVLGVITHLNAPRVPMLKSLVTSFEGSAIQTVMPLQDDIIHHAGQPIAVVVADTWEEAEHAAGLVCVEYEVQAPRVELEAHLDDAYPPQPFFGGIPPAYVRGDPARGLAEAAIRVEQMYTTPIEHHNPMEPHAAVATWDGDAGRGQWAGGYPNAPELTVFDTTQGVYLTRQGLVEALGLTPEHVRVVCPFVGGGFGKKGGLWPYTVLAAIAARQVGRPVRLVLTRAQMYTSAGYRSQTVQEVRLGAHRDGTLTAIVHHSTSIGSAVGEHPEPAPEVTRILYACPNVKTKLGLVQLDLGVPTSMRAPGEATGSFALESALDELACELGMDPIELRLRNYAETDPESGKPWSSKALRACYAQAAERFGWARRNPEPRSMRDGRWLVGWGMATASYPTVGFPAEATATIRADGRAVVRSGTADLGTGQYTVMTQVASDALGLPPERVAFELGDTNLPFAFVAGGSSGVRSVGPAVRKAAEAARAKVLELAASDEDSPLAGYGPDAIGAEGSEFFLKHAPAQRESYAAILARHGLDEVTGEGSVGMVGMPNEHRVNAFGAQFVEVRVDPDLGVVRVTRALGAFDIGTVLNPKTARSQAIGGIVFGIGMALLERTAIHPQFGKVVSPNLSGYLVPVHADVPAVDAFFVHVEDPYVNSLGAKGAGELGITGVAAAIANAVYHATGKRIRNLPINLDMLL